MSHLGENETAMWKRLIELGTFDEFYPQRLNACFRYLDVDKAQCFSLKVQSSTRAICLNEINVCGDCRYCRTLCRRAFSYSRT